MTLHLLAVTALLGLLYFSVTAGLVHPVVTVIWGALTGLGAVWLVKLVESGADATPSRLPRASLLAVAAAGLGVVLKALVVPDALSWWDAGGLAIAGASGFAGRLAGPHGRACFLCKRPTTSASGTSFACPRCGQHVCPRPGCWNSRAHRCTACAERGVVLFPIANSWWDKQFGPRSPHGACGHCYKEANETDLRDCGQCGWPLCRRCWDHHNGVCPRCAWTVAGVPAEIRALAAGQRKHGGGGKRRSAEQRQPRHPER